METNIPRTKAKPKPRAKANPREDLTNATPKARTRKPPISKKEDIDARENQKDKDAIRAELLEYV